MSTLMIFIFKVYLTRLFQKHTFYITHYNSRSSKVHFHQDQIVFSVRNVGTWMQLFELSLDGKVSYAGSSSLRNPKLSIGLPIQQVFKHQTKQICHKSYFWRTEASTVPQRKRKSRKANNSSIIQEPPPPPTLTHFTEPEVSLPYLKGAATCPYHVPDWSVPSYFIRPISILSSHLHLSLPSGLFT
jgi:hypothetical protein